MVVMYKHVAWNTLSRYRHCPFIPAYFRYLCPSRCHGCLGCHTCTAVGALYGNFPGEESGASVENDPICCLNVTAPWSWSLIYKAHMCMAPARGTCVNLDCLSMFQRHCSMVVVLNLRGPHVYGYLFEYLPSVYLNHHICTAGGALYGCFPGDEPGASMKSDRVCCLNVAAPWLGSLIYEARMCMVNCLNIYHLATWTTTYVQQVVPSMGVFQVMNQVQAWRVIVSAV